VSPKADASRYAAELKAARKQADAAQRKRSSALKSELARLDRQLAEMQQQQQEIELQLAAANIYDAANKSRLRELLEQQIKLKHELDQAETDWLEVTELLQPKSGDALSQ